MALTEVYSSIIAGNTNRDVNFTSNIANTFQSNGYNLIGTGNALGDFNQPGDQTGVTNPMLGPLADNGGPTMTHALLVGSPAIDAGDPAAVAGTANVPLYDQRGAPFTRVFDGDGAGGARIDIGAFELQPIPPAFYGDYNQNGELDAADYVVWRKTLGASGLVAYSGADGSGNGTIDQADYDVWRAHFGQTVPPAGAGAAIEPAIASAALLAGDSSVVDLISPTTIDRPESHGSTYASLTESLASTHDTATSIVSRPAVRSGRSAAIASAAGLRDAALVAWLTARNADDHQNHRDRIDQRNDATTVCEEADGDLPVDALDATFASLVKSAASI